MDFEALSEKAIKVRQMYDELNAKKYKGAWGLEQLVQGFMGDVGDLAKLVMAREGWRGGEDVEKKLAHELSDCLWSLLVLANKCGVDLEKEFVATMSELEERISKEGR